MNHWQHNDNVYNIYDTKTLVHYLQDQMTGRPSLPVLMKTLDLPGTSPIGRQPGRRNRKKRTRENKGGEREKIVYNNMRRVWPKSDHIEICD